MSALTDFLLARIAEDEAVARGADGEMEPWTLTDVGNVTAFDKRLIASIWIQNARHVARFDPARVLAECEAKRRIVEEVEVIRRQRFAVPGVGSLSLNYSLDSILRGLALPYADHPDFDPAWRL